MIERYAYTAYGELTVLNANGSADADNLSDVGNPYAYTGRRIDPETGLQYFRARYYDGKLGRFLQRDPLGYPDGMNGYAGYFSMNGKVDPLGLIGNNPYMDREWAELILNYIIANNLEDLGGVHNNGGNLTNDGEPWNTENCIEDLLYGHLLSEGSSSFVFDLGMELIFGPITGGAGRALNLTRRARRTIETVRDTIEAIENGEFPELDDVAEKLLSTYGGRFGKALAELVDEVDDAIEDIAGEDCVFLFTSNVQKQRNGNKKVGTSCAWVVCGNVKDVLGPWNKLEEWVVFGTCDYQCQTFGKFNTCCCGSRRTWSVFAGGKGSGIDDLAYLKMISHHPDNELVEIK